MSALPNDANGKRAADKMGWVSKVGFPAFVAWYLLTQQPAHLDEKLEADRKVRDEQTLAIVHSLEQLTVAIKENTQATREQRERADQVFAVILDRYSREPLPARTVRARPVERVP